MARGKRTPRKKMKRVFQKIPEYSKRETKEDLEEDITESEHATFSKVDNLDTGEQNKHLL